MWRTPCQRRGTSILTGTLHYLHHLMKYLFVVLVSIGGRRGYLAKYSDPLSKRKVNIQRILCRAKVSGAENFIKVSKFVNFIIQQILGGVGDSESARYGRDHEADAKKKLEQILGREIHPPKKFVDRNRALNEPSRSFTVPGEGH